MAENYLITGYHGTPHVTAENDRGINAGIFGTGRFVLPVGEQFKAENIGNNTIRMYDGKLIDNGAAAGIPAGEYIDFVISTGTQSLKRIDLIVFDYRKNSSTMIETGTFKVVSGTETSGTPEAPSLTRNNLLSGSASVDQMGLYSVTVENGAITDISALFTVKSPVSTAGGRMDGQLGFVENIGGVEYRGFVGLNDSTGTMLVGHVTNDEQDNYMVLAPEETGFMKPVRVSSGGTGANNAADARKNLGITPENIGAAAKDHGTHVTFATGTPKAPGTGSAGSANTVARSDHEHPKQTEVTGNAGTATKLKTARTIQTNLASGDTASFDGSANVTPGVKGVLPMANGGSGVANLGDAPINAIIRMNNEGKNLWYTPTASGAFYATDDNASPKFGTLPLSMGGLGSSKLSEAPDYAIMRKYAGADQLWYTPTNSGAFYATSENGMPQFGTLPTPQGGTGLDMSTIPAYSIIRANSEPKTNSNLYYTETADGAFFATAEHGAPRFGTLPVGQGGTGATSPADARTKLGITPANIGALPLTGGTLTGTVNNTGGSYTATKTVDDVEHKGSVGVNGTDGGTYINHRSDGTEDNFLFLTGNTTNFKVPLSITGGGTGGATAEEARTKLGAAPSGYGVGDTAKTITSLLDVLKSGKSGKYKGSNVGGAPNEYYWYFDVICMGTTYGTVNAYHSELINMHCRAVYKDGTLGDWEWTNPPMYENIEYKTSRMAAGSKIYTKRITYTNTAAVGTSSTTVEIEIQHGISGFAYIQSVRCKSGSYLLPYFNTTGGSLCVKRVTDTAVILQFHNVGWNANQTFTIDLEYTKSS